MLQIPTSSLASFPTILTRTQNLTKVLTDATTRRLQAIRDTCQLEPAMTSDEKAHRFLKPVYVSPRDHGVDKAS